MRRLELEPGVHRLDTITEPTEIVATERWRAILEPAADLAACLNLRASCTVRGCQIRFATGDKGDQRVEGGGEGVSAHDGCELVELDDCWIHHCTNNGVLTRANTALRMNRCLVERCGSHTQFSHSMYLCGWYAITNSLFLHNAKFSVMSAYGHAVGILYRCVAYGSGRNRTLLHEGRKGRMVVLHCTLFGEPPTDADGELVKLHRSNLLFPNSQDYTGTPELAYPQYHLFMPAERIPSQPGAYDYYEDLHSREQAEAYWRSGCMDGWGDQIYTDRHPYPFPLFPGDAVPLQQAVEVIADRQGG